MKSFLNFLRKNKAYTAINLIGLSLSMTFVLLLAVYVQKQVSTDSFQEKGDRIMIIGNNWYASALHLKDHMAGKYPEIESFCAFAHENKIEVSVDGHKVYADMNYADSTFFDLFSFKTVQGDAEAFKHSVNNLIVSESFARKAFPDKDAVGQLIGGMPVVAIMEDIDNSVIPYCDILMRSESLEQKNPSHNMDLGNSGSIQTFVLVKENCDLTAKKDEMFNHFKEFWWVYSGGICDELHLIPLNDIYFHETDLIPQLQKGDLAVVNMLAVVCIILLIFTIFNYINMTTATAGFRATEMASRRLVGASRRSIFMKMIAESTILCLVSTVIAAFLAEALSPAASTMLDYDFSIFEALTPGNIFIALSFIVVLGLVSGLTPALILLRVQPIDIVKGSYKVKTKTIGSAVMITLQTVTTMCILIAAITMNRQINHMINAPLGYNTEGIINIDNRFGMPANLSVVKDKLMALPCVKNVGYGQGTPLYGTNNNTQPIKNLGYISFQQIIGDQGYFDILGFEEKLDNNTPYTFWLNEFAFKELGLDENEKLYYQGTDTWDYALPIGGVYKDFKIRPLLENQSAAQIFNYRDKWPEQLYPWNILVQVNGDEAEAFSAVKDTFAEVFPDVFFQGTYISDEIEDTFKRETTILDIITIFTVISIFVSMLGLFAMSMYYTAQAKKSVALKSIMGAGRQRIIGELSGPFMKMTCLAVVIGAPLGWFLMDKWLDTFSYRIPLYWWIIAISAVIILATAFLAICHETRKAADTNPVDSLKNE